jgi:hypothetical protein
MAWEKTLGHALAELSGWGLVRAGVFKIFGRGAEKC